MIWIILVTASYLVCGLLVMGITSVILTSDENRISFTGAMFSILCGLLWPLVAISFAISMIITCRKDAKAIRQQLEQKRTEH